MNRAYDEAIWKWLIEASRTLKIQRVTVVASIEIGNITIASLSQDQNLATKRGGELEPSSAVYTSCIHQDF
jgi:hypothetical protein